MDWTHIRNDLMTKSFWVVSKGKSWSADSTINKMSLIN